MSGLRRIFQTPAKAINSSATLHTVNMLCGNMGHWVLGTEWLFLVAVSGKSETATQTPMDSTRVLSLAESKHRFTLEPCHLYGNICTEVYIMHITRLFIFDFYLKFVSCLYFVIYILPFWNKTFEKDECLSFYYICKTSNIFSHHHIQNK